MSVMGREISVVPSCSAPFGKIGGQGLYIINSQRVIDMEPHHSKYLLWEKLARKKIQIFEKLINV